MATLYRIRDWNIHYETHETRKLKNLRWIPMPNKHDGLTFKKIASRKDRCEIFTAWILMLQIASKCPVRGQLSADSPGNLPLSPGDMGLKTGFPGEIFEKALQALSDGPDSWILKENANTVESPETSGELPGVPPKTSAVLNGREGIEGKVEKEQEGWREFYTVYEKECEAAFDTFASNAEWMEQRKEFYPNLDIYKTMKKAFIEFWGTKAGWEHKKAKHAKTIDWEKTILNAISMKSNQVYLVKTKDGAYAR